MDARHRRAPAVLAVRSYPSCDLARAYCRVRLSFSQDCQDCRPCNLVRHFRFCPDVMRSGFFGGFQSGGRTGRCRLVPSPIVPGCWRASPDVSAASASVASAPPRMRLMRSRSCRAFSKSRSLAAISISRWRSSRVLLISRQRADIRFSAAGFPSSATKKRKMKRTRERPAGSAEPETIVGYFERRPLDVTIIHQANH